LFVDKPVLFYQFDFEKFNSYRGAYNGITDLFGPVVYDADSAVQQARKLVESDFDCADYKAKMDEWKNRAFPYHDARNCERIVCAIRHLLHGSPGQGPSITDQAGARGRVRDIHDLD
jgi:CDP-glycerol glycerophosphotransferase (TagB/SpsB family)